MLSRDFLLHVRIIVTMNWLLIAALGGVAMAADPAPPPAADQPQPPPDPFAVPDGDPAELLAFIDSVRKQPATPENQPKIREAVLEAVEKILAAKPDEKQSVAAARAKAELLEDTQELRDFRDELIKADLPQAAKEPRIRLLIIDLNGSKAGGPAEIAKRLEEVKRFVLDTPRIPGQERPAEHAVRVAEQTGKTDFAAEVYTELGKTLETIDDGYMKWLGAQWQGIARRIMLPGKFMHLEGKTLDGKELDWASFRGKVVLVDFWATWCGPCRGEVPNMKENYKKYHDRGFEIIGISVDRMPTPQLAEWVKNEDLPWTICRAMDWPKNMAQYYGVSGIPTMILLDREGKVISLAARRDALNAELAKLFPADEDQTPAVAEPAQKPADRSAADDQAAHKEERSKRETERLAALRQDRQVSMKANAPKVRDWTDSTGKYRVTAKFRGVLSGTVKLETEDSKVITLPLERLSVEDQTYIRQRRQVSP